MSEPFVGLAPVAVDQTVGAAVRAGLRGLRIEDAADGVRRVLEALVRAEPVASARRRAHGPDLGAYRGSFERWGARREPLLDHGNPPYGPRGAEDPDPPPAVERPIAEPATPAAAGAPSEGVAEPGPTEAELAELEARAEPLDDDPPSAWDPEPVSSVVSAGIQGRAFEDRERTRMQAGFYTDPPPAQFGDVDDDGAPAAETATAGGAEAAPVEGLTRDQRRSRRRRQVRSRTISMKRLPKHDLEAGRGLYPEETARLRPRSRGECVGGARPCPFVSCEHHLYLDVSPATGAIQLNFPDLEVEDMAESCARDVAARGGATLEDVAVMMNLTRERIRQIEVKALGKLERRPQMRALAADFDLGGTDGKRHLAVVPGDGRREDRAA
jgi:hypothetical protein